jgi:hypothetical protein
MTESALPTAAWANNQNLLTAANLQVDVVKRWLSLTVVLKEKVLKFDNYLIVHECKSGDGQHKAVEPTALCKDLK